MSEYLSVFRSKFGEDLVSEAYTKLLSNWIVPYEDLYLDTELGKTHIIISGQTDSPPLILIHAFYASAASWYQNVRSFSRSYRVYAIENSNICYF